VPFKASVSSINCIVRLKIHVSRKHPINRHLGQEGQRDEAEDDGDDGVGEAGSGKAEVEVAAESQSGVLSGVAVAGCKKR
jgi:hypothetical protein